MTLADFAHYLLGYQPISPPAMVPQLGPRRKQRFIVHSDSLTIETTCTYTFKETDAGTRVRWQYERELHGVFKAAAPLLPGVLLRLHQRQIRVAKEILEAAA